MFYIILCFAVHIPINKLETHYWIKFYDVHIRGVYNCDRPLSFTVSVFLMF